VVRRARSVRVRPGDRRQRKSQAHALEFIAKQLVGKNAEFAGDEEFTKVSRAFGHVYISRAQESPTIAETFVNGMTEDGATRRRSAAVHARPGDIQSQASQIDRQAEVVGGDDGAVLASDGVAPRDFTREATAQGYFPEWVLVEPALSDLTAFGRTYDQEQWANAFGVTHTGGTSHPEIAGYYNLYQWWSGKEPPAKDTIDLLMPNYTFLAAVLQAPVRT
jgi:hypothetical protein